MTATNDNTVSGEQRLKARRSSFVRYLAIVMAASLAMGFATGRIEKLIQSGALAPWVMIVVITLLVAFFAWFAVDYFKRVDELDMQDNLWSSLIAFYFFLVAAPTWLFLHEAGLVPQPDLWVIWAVTVAFSLAVYGARKLGWR